MLRVERESELQVLGSNGLFYRQDTFGGMFQRHNDEMTEPELQFFCVVQKSGRARFFIESVGVYGDDEYEELLNEIVVNIALGCRVLRSAGFGWLGDGKERRCYRVFDVAIERPVPAQYLQGTGHRYPTGSKFVDFGALWG